MGNISYTNRAQEEIDNIKKEVSQDRFIFERALTSAEISNKRLWITNIVLILALILSNCAWIYYESQWQYVESSTQIEQDVEQDTSDGGDNTFVGGDYYGSTESENDNNE